MKKSTLLVSAMAVLTLGLSSCANLGDYSLAPNSEIGAVGETVTGTVIAAETLRAESSTTAKNLGTGIGAVAGAASGSLLGGGTGQIVSAAGFGILGAVAGREIGKAVGESTVQRLTIQADNRRNYTITQPVYKQFGEIPVGAQGVLTIRSQNSTFAPY